MNEVGLNAKWLQADLTYEKTQKFAKDVLNHMRERLSDYQEPSTAICIIWKRLRQNPPLTVWLNTTYSNSQISKQRRNRVELRIIRIVLIFPLDIRRISSLLWIFRMSCRLYILPVLFFTLSWVKNLPRLEGCCRSDS